ncbi:DUF5906 domain-containing protein [Bradyrhizobium quebecense]|uniref:NrS-1 polymerase-like helicase domain-containing protein n=1 Tax=Bradyrhizobium quebecense TaxID=2748629 RepID=A0A973WSG7_9BRAD|nr:primase-helicase family protein [Bradyrhizobium quebecense]UGA45663.1 DUF5906 domain-containing protein [Bradyrhizobium quebecense]
MDNYHEAEPGAIQGDKKYHVTFFKNAAAKTLTTEQLTLEELAERVRNASSRKKSKLPWLKMARFGSMPSDKGCLRHDGNVIEVSGGELDYDFEKIAFDAAVFAITELRICAVLYTSASHTPATPRWRVLTPYSKMQPPAMRKQLVARLNGALKAKLGDAEIARAETFALSQSYYFGWLSDSPKPDHRAVVVAGDFIDLRDDLQQYEANGGPPAGKSDDTRPNNNNDSRQDRVHGFDAILSEIGDGIGKRGFNDVLTRAAASYVSLHRGNPFDRGKLKALLRDAINAAPKNPTRNVVDMTRYISDKYLDDAIASAERKYVEVRSITVDDFVSVMSAGDYLFIPTREMWPGKSVNACIPPMPLTKRDGSPLLDKKTKEPILMAASAWLDRNRRVEQLSWVPGFAEVIRDRLVCDGGWLDRVGASIFNLYRPSALDSSALASANVIPDIRPWYDHLKAIYPDDAEHILKFLAHRCQKPFDKINHNLLLGGAQGIGKDSLLEPIRYAVGPWNFQEISPTSMLGQFNGYLRAVVLRISEARDLGDVNRYQLYEHMKTICAAPPPTHRINEKNLREHYIFNCCAVITTTNHKTGGIYLPADDRRTYVAWSHRTKDDFTEQYWIKLWDWLVEKGGIRNVAVFLRGFDLKNFNPKAPPPKTVAFHEIVASGVPSEEIELTDLIERMGNPDALTLAQLTEHVGKQAGLSELEDWINKRDNKKVLPHRLEMCGYARTPNPDNKQGLWIIESWMCGRWENGKPVGEKIKQRQQVYAKAALSYSDQIKAVRTMIKQIESKADGEREAEMAARAKAFDFNSPSF